MNRIESTAGGGPGPIRQQPRRDLGSESRPWLPVRVTVLRRLADDSDATGPGRCADLNLNLE